MIVEQNHIIILKPIIRNDPSLVYWSVQAAEIHFHPRSGTPWRLFTASHKEAYGIPPA